MHRTPKETKVSSSARKVGRKGSKFRGKGGTTEKGYRKDGDGGRYLSRDENSRTHWVTRVHLLGSVRGIKFQLTARRN